MAMRELQEISQQEGPVLRRVQPVVSIRTEVSLVPSGQIEIQENKLRKTREVLKLDYPPDVSLQDCIEYKVAELGVRILTSKPFTPDYTYSKESDAKAKKSQVDHLIPRNTGGPSSVNSALHSASLLLELLRRRLG